MVYVVGAMKSSLKEKQELEFCLQTQLLWQSYKVLPSSPLHSQQSHQSHIVPKHICKWISISRSISSEKYFQKVEYEPVLVLLLPHLSAGAMGHVGRDRIPQALQSL